MQHLVRILAVVMALPLLGPGLECAGPAAAHRSAMSCCQQMKNVCRQREAQGAWDCCQGAVVKSAAASLTIPPSRIDGQSALAPLPVAVVRAPAPNLMVCTAHLIVTWSNPPPRLPLFVVHSVFRI